MRLLIVLLTLTCACVASAEPRLSYVALVVRGTATVGERPIFEGMRLMPQESVKLLPGASIQVLGAGGRLKFEGGAGGKELKLPEVRAGSGAPGYLLILTRVLESVMEFAERGRSDASAAPLGAIRIDTPGAKCVQAGNSPLIDGAALVGRSATLRDLEAEKTVVVQLSSQYTQWPEALKVAPDAMYEAAVDGTGQTVTWRFTTVPASNDDTALVQAYAEAGCLEQLLGLALSTPFQPAVER